MGTYVLHFRQIDQTKLMEVGGKALQLGELCQIEDVQVPNGFCVTTAAYRQAMEQENDFQRLRKQLMTLKLDDRSQISQISEQIRQVIAEVEIPKEVEAEVAHAISQMGAEYAYAVRSSATAEDLPTASFAGQQDTFLNIKGKEAILQHIRKCWASLFTERAVLYRIQNGYHHEQVYLAVIIQRMVFPEASGILFTADPVTSNRKVISIDASFGLGEALVSGLVNPDRYQIRNEKIIQRTISKKERAIYARAEGGTEAREIQPHLQQQQTLTDQQILQLEKIGRKIEAYFGCPQDIEWCLENGRFYLVQSRPITTLFPLPELKDDQTRVFMSFGHQQMMTEAIRPLGMSFLKLISSNTPLYQAGGRLFLDISHDLASSVGRKIVLSAMKNNEPLMHSAILSLVKQKKFIKALPQGKKVFSTQTEGISLSYFVEALKIYRQNDPTIIQKLTHNSELSIKELKQSIATVSGDDLFAFILEDYKRLKEIMFNPQGMGLIILVMYVTTWLNKKIEKWLGEKHVVDVLSQSVPNNVTSEMGLELLDVADVVRSKPAVMKYFAHAKDETFFADLSTLDGGDQVADAMHRYLEKYGMRCNGEIDITRTRWREKPTSLIPMILNNVHNFAPHSRYSKFEQGRLEAEQKERELLDRLKQLPSGTRKAKKVKKMISLLRNFIGYREYPKYDYIRRYEIYKQALMKEANKLVHAGVIQETEDIYYLSFEELRNVVRTHSLDYRIITKRKADYAFYEQLTPPRIMTSEGENVFGEYQTEGFPAGALAGLPVSSGMIEGRARVVLKLEEAHLEEGDILVTAFTDPSWTPLFVSVKGLVTEVGGQMTHGSVIAREYGLPAIVGVRDATKKITDGQRIRVNGTEGYIELL